MPRPRQHEHGEVAGNKKYCGFCRKWMRAENFSVHQCPRASVAATNAASDCSSGRHSFVYNVAEKKKGFNVCTACGLYVPGPDMPKTISWKENATMLSEIGVRSCGHEEHEFKIKLSSDHIGISCKRCGFVKEGALKRQREDYTPLLEALRGAIHRLMGYSEDAPIPEWVQNYRSGEAPPRGGSVRVPGSTVVVTDGDEHMWDSDANAASEEVCSICQFVYVAGNTVKKICCGHRFHAECIENYVRFQPPSGVCQCPMCRADIPGIVFEDAAADARSDTVSSSSSSDITNETDIVDFLNSVEQGIDLPT